MHNNMDRLCNKLMIDSMIRNIIFNQHMHFLTTTNAFVVIIEFITLIISLFLGAILKQYQIIINGLVLILYIELFIGMLILSYLRDKCYKRAKKDLDDINKQLDLIFNINTSDEDFINQLIEEAKKMEVNNEETKIEETDK